MRRGLVASSDRNCWVPFRFLLPFSRTKSAAATRLLWREYSNHTKHALTSPLCTRIEVQNFHKPWNLATQNCASCIESPQANSSTITIWEQCDRAVTNAPRNLVLILLLKLVLILLSELSGNSSTSSTVLCLCNLMLLLLISTQLTALEVCLRNNNFSYFSGWDSVDIHLYFDQGGLQNSCQ